MLDKLSQHPIFAYFEKISSIPRPSGNTDRIADWLVEFANEHKLECYRDDFDNVIIIREASHGMEDNPSVILQAHTDMVCEKDPGLDFDFKSSGIELCVCDDYIKANGTTLGADNGIGVALILAVLSDVTIALPRIEAVFTSDEETGMIGASNLDISKLKSKMMINIDADVEGEFIVGCAGGNVSSCSFDVIRSDCNLKSCRICVKGLRGGHSGIEIDSGRANSNVLIARFLDFLSSRCYFRLICIDGGSKDNVICSYSTAKIVCDDIKLVRDAKKEFLAMIKEEYSQCDPDIEIEISECEYSVPMDEKSTKNIIDFILLAPNGIQDMSKSIEGLVETSLNLGILSTQNDKVYVSYCVRSCLNSKKSLISEKLRKLCMLYEGSFTVSGDYPAWEYRSGSHLSDLFIKKYQNMFGKTPKIVTIHAGLECGIFASQINDFDCISFGPDLLDIHTPREKVSTISVCRMWDLLINILSDLNFPK